MKNKIQKKKFGIDIHIDITQEHGHWVVYINGEEYCTGDTYLEVVQELTEDGYL